MIEIVFFDTNKLSPSNSLNDLIQDFSSIDKARALRYKDLQSGINFAIGRLMLKDILVSKGMDGNLIHQIEYNESRKPFLSQFNFNISHSGSYVVCAHGDEDLGIDIESLRPMDLTAFNNWFSVQEWNEIIKSENPSHRLLYYWTAKESVLKLIGTDLAKAADIEVINDRQAVFKENIYPIQSFMFEDKKVIGHICRKKPIGAFELRFFDF